MIKAVKSTVNISAPQINHFEFIMGCDLGQKLNNAIKMGIMMYSEHLKNKCTAVITPKVAKMSEPTMFDQNEM